METRPATHFTLLAHKPGLEKREAAREILTRFATRAYRRPVTKTETVSQSVVDDLRRSVQARDLVLEKDSASIPGAGASGATYVVNRAEVGQAVTATIQLVHAQ